MVLVKMTTAGSVHHLLAAINQGHKHIKCLTIDRCHAAHLDSSVAMDTGGCYAQIQQGATYSSVVARKVPLTEQDMLDVLDSATRNMQIREICISGCEGLLTEKVCTHLGTLLQNDSHIDSLVLKNCGLSDKEFQSITVAFKNNKTLTKLDVSENTISSGGLVALSGVLPWQHKLAVLDVSENPCRGEGVRLIERLVDDFTCTFEEDD